MARYDATFEREVAAALSFAGAGEIVRVKYGGARVELPVQRMELMYELAFLKVFNAWETFLETTLVRYLMGHASQQGPEVMVAGTYCRDLASAEAMWLGGWDFRSWYDPTKCANRCARLIDKGRHEQVLRSAVDFLEACAAVRHRVGHGQKHARGEFDSVTLTLASRRYRESRAGAFLRDFVPTSTPQQRWLSKLAEDMVQLARQVLP